MRKYNLIFVLAVAVSFFFVLDSSAQAQILFGGFCDQIHGPAIHICDAYCNTGCDGDPDSKKCSAIEAAFFRIADPAQLSACNGMIPNCNPETLSFCTGICPGDQICVQKLCGPGTVCVDP